MGYLKEDYYNTVDWKNSSVLAESEKQTIINRTKSKSEDNVNNNNNNGQHNDENKENHNNNDTPVYSSKEEEEFAMKYGSIRNENKYNEYNDIYKEKYDKMLKWTTSIKENTDYFKRM